MDVLCGRAMSLNCFKYKQSFLVSKNVADIYDRSPLSSEGKDL